MGQCCSDNSAGPNLTRRIHARSALGRSPVHGFEWNRGQENGPMKRTHKVLFVIINSALLAAVATMLILIVSSRTGARLSGWAASALGALIGSVVSYAVFRH